MVENTASISDQKKKVKLGDLCSELERREMLQKYWRGEIFSETYP